MTPPEQDRHSDTTTDAATPVAGDGLPGSPHGDPLADDVVEAGGAASEISSVEEMSDEEKRRDQLLRAAGSTEEDAAPRIEVSKRDGVTRIDIAPDAVVRPGTAE